ncbi:hypothetical protein [Homoserinibacter sp. YIM 151385]|uniref:hypothetical protein n=1 Tax=Homoserinibacter sp. YIM 151385 TaxID=2985506 RepID=UPI0022F11040|nr:hypothetical protein [Homoserinibacter sp. YIM 151385]WBU39279.1 hypothetical protein OF852_06805 [Homoserinibacter sp. YIM 151385]
MTERTPDPDLEPDDDALRWEGDEELGRSGVEDRMAAVDRRRAGADDEGADGGDAEGSDAVAVASGSSRGQGGRTFATGLFALVFLLLTIGWILTVQQRFGTAALGVTAVLDGLGDFLTMIAPGLWFATTLHLTRDRRLRIRLGWLALGTGLLVPWPILPLLVGAAS